MKKSFACMMGLALLMFFQFLVLAFVTDPGKNNQSQVRTQPTNSVNFEPCNMAKVEFFGQSHYEEENLSLTIGMTGDMGNYGNITIHEMNPTSAGASEKFYQKFIGDTAIRIIDYKVGKPGKEIIKEKLEQASKRKHLSVDFNELLHQFLISQDGGDVFYKIFTGEKDGNNIAPESDDFSVDEMKKMYRRDGQVFQLEFKPDTRKRREENETDEYFIPDYSVRVFPNTGIVNTSSILRYFRSGHEGRIGSKNVIGPTGSTLIVKVNSSFPRILYYVDEIFKHYVGKFHLSEEEQHLLSGNKTGDAEQHHPKFYKYEEKDKNPLQRPEKPNCGFSIEDPGDESKIYKSLPLILLASFS